MKPRTILIFENSIKTEATRKIYNYALKRFVEYYKLKSVESILEIEDKKLQEMLEDYLFHFKSKNRKAATIRTYFAAIELLCVVNDKVGINFKKLHKMFPANTKKSGKNAYSTNEIDEMLQRTKELRTKAFIHILASTGMRIGALPELKLRHVIDMPDNCMAIHVYEDSDEEYWSFLTPEATKHVKNYLNKRTRDGESLIPSSPLIRERYSLGIAKPKHTSRSNLRTILHRLIKITPLSREKEGIRFDVMEAHGMRKRFNTILKMNKNISPACTEKLMGHKINMDGVYFVPTREDLFNDFKKAIPDLTVDDAQRKQVLLEQKEKENSDLQKQIGVSADLQSQIDQINREKAEMWKVTQQLILEKHADPKN